MLNDWKDQKKYAWRAPKSTSLNVREDIDICIALVGGTIAAPLQDPIKQMQIGSSIHGPFKYQLIDFPQEN